MFKQLTLLFFATLYSISACATNTSLTLEELRAAYSKPTNQWPRPNVDASVEFKELGLIPPMPYPDELPHNQKIYNLGYQLFHDGALSASGQIACASCHDPDLGWADGRRVSFGHNRQAGTRNAPTIENAGFLSALFWDGRASSLEHQALMPIQDPKEMNFTLGELVTRLSNKEHYTRWFNESFGSEEITAQRIAQALATFQRTIVSRRSDFDYFLLSQQQTDPKRKALYNQRMSDKALWGLHLFRTKARCINCHNGPLFTDGKFHNIGLTWYGRKYEDLGRYNVTKDPADVGKFKTPGLRGVMNTKPWMHNGLFADMTGIINIYNAGGVPTKKDPDDPLSPVTSPLLQPLLLTPDEKDALIAFLQSITAPPARAVKP